MQVDCFCKHQWDDVNLIKLFLLIRSWNQQLRPCLQKDTSEGWWRSGHRCTGGRWWPIKGEAWQKRLDLLAILQTQRGLTLALSEVCRVFWSAYLNTSSYIIMALARNPRFTSRILSPFELILNQFEVDVVIIWSCMHVYANFFSLSLNETLWIRLNVLFAWGLFAGGAFWGVFLSGARWWEVFSWNWACLP